MKGKLLGGRYEILEQIDSGGMAFVYKARCRKTNNIVAIKILKDKFAGNTEYVNRFKREAQAAFALECEHIVSVNDVGYDENVYYMVMEFVDGPTLKTVIEKNEKLPEKKAIEYALQICSALSTAHKNGIIHRDVKPRNIMIDKHDNIKVTDFGIAQSLTDGVANDGQVIGSVYYVSPEQAKGEKIDQRSDIYSLGIVLYFMLTGKLPYTGEKSISVALKHINEQITPPIKHNSDISKSINNIIIKATSKDKTDRYNNIEELKTDLTLSLVDKDGEFVDIKQVSKKNILTLNLRKNRIWKIAVITFTLVLLTVVIVYGRNAILGNSKEQTNTISLYHVQNFIGMSLEEAEEKIQNSGLNVVVVYENSSDFDVNTVMDQSPTGGNDMQIGDSVLLTVSLGVEIVYMPNLIGLTEFEALQIIEDMGLTVEDKIEQMSSEFPSGTVIAQEPSADSDILEDAAVNIVIAKEPEENIGIVPQLVDTSVEQAAQVLRDAGFVNTFVYQEKNIKEPGTVISQTPLQGEPKAFDSDIDLHISEYIDQKYIAQFDETISITEIGTKVKIVFEEILNESTVNFIMHENTYEPGEHQITIEASSMTGGFKKVKVYLNNNIIAYEFNLYFYDRSENVER